MNPLRRLADLALRPLATAINRARRALRKAGAGPSPGAHAIALTPGRRVILVRLRYAPGWRLPGGGRSDGESVVDVALRELREEIGMTGHGAVRQLPEIDPALVLVEDVTYAPPRWSLEVERIVEAELDSLPHGMSPLFARLVAAFRQAD